MSDKPIDRDGVGKTLIRKLGEQTDTEGFRTTSIDTAQGRVTMRTKGGMPEVTRERKQEKGCKLLPLKEIDANIPQGNTQDARLYHHDHEKDSEIPERRVFSSDGIFSLPVTPLKKILFRSKGLGSRVEVWLNDHTVPASHDDPMKAGTIEQVVPEEDPSKPSKGAIILIEQAKRDPAQGVSGSPYKGDELAFTDDTDGKLHRRFYPPTFLYQPNPKENGDWGSLFGMAMVFARIKSMTFDVHGIPGVNRAKAWFARHIPAIKRSQKPNGAVGEAYERDMHKRVFWKIGQPWVQPGYAQNVQTIKMNGGNVDLAPPYGVLSPLPKGYIHTLDPAEKCEVQPADGSANYTDFARLSSVSHLLTFGQPWHGILNTFTGELRKESGELVTTFAPSDLTPMVGYHAAYFNFGKKHVELPISTTYPSNDLIDNTKLLGDAVFVNGRYTYGAGNTRLLNTGFSGPNGGFAHEFVVRNTTHARKMMVECVKSEPHNVVRFFDLGEFVLIAESGYVAPQPVLVSTHTVKWVEPNSIQVTFVTGDNGYACHNLFRATPDHRTVFLGNAIFNITGDIGSGGSVTLVKEKVFTADALFAKAPMESLEKLNVLKQDSPPFYRAEQQTYVTSDTHSISGTATFVFNSATQQWVSKTGSTTYTANVQYSRKFRSIIRSFALLDVFEKDGKFICVEGVTITTTESEISMQHSGSDSSTYDINYPFSTFDSKVYLAGVVTTRAEAHTKHYSESILYVNGAEADRKLSQRSQTSGPAVPQPPDGFHTWMYQDVQVTSVTNGNITTSTFTFAPKTASMIPPESSWLLTEYQAHPITQGWYPTPITYTENLFQTSAAVGSTFDGVTLTSFASFFGSATEDAGSPVPSRGSTLVSTPVAARVLEAKLRHVITVNPNNPSTYLPKEFVENTYMSQSVFVAGIPLTPAPGQTVHYDYRTGQPGLNDFGGVIVI